MVLKATLSKTPTLFPPRFCSIVPKTIRAAPAVLILPVLEESRLVVVALYENRTAINHNGLPSSESFLHQEQIGLRDLGSFADSANWETVAHALV